MGSPFEAELEEENRCLFCNRRDPSGQCGPFKMIVKGGLERFDCPHFILRKPNPPNPGKGGCAGCG